MLLVAATQYALGDAFYYRTTLRPIEFEIPRVNGSSPLDHAISFSELLS